MKIHRKRVMLNSEIINSLFFVNIYNMLCNDANNNISYSNMNGQPNSKIYLIVLAYQIYSLSTASSQKSRAKVGPNCA